MFKLLSAALFLFELLSKRNIMIDALQSVYLIGSVDKDERFFRGELQDFVPEELITACLDDLSNGEVRRFNYNFQNIRMELIPKLRLLFVGRRIPGIQLVLYIRNYLRPFMT
jgi:hypothetical protein